MTALWALWLLTRSPMLLVGLAVLNLAFAVVLTVEGERNSALVFAILAGLLGLAALQVNRRLRGKAKA
jgi:NAD/NADP transhydrogenase alpha subunit